MKGIRSQDGVTLLEAMIATSIFAFVSFQSYSVVTNMTKQKSSMERKFSQDLLESMIKNEMDKDHFRLITVQKNGVLSQCVTNYDNCPKNEFGIDLFKRRGSKEIRISGKSTGQSVVYDKSGGLIGDTGYSPAYRIYSKAKAINIFGPLNGDKRPESIHITVQVQEFKKNTWRNKTTINKMWDIRPRAQLRAAKKGCGTAEGYRFFARQVKYGDLVCNWTQRPSTLPARFKGVRGPAGENIKGDTGGAGNNACKHCTVWDTWSETPKVFRYCDPC